MRRHSWGDAIRPDLNNTFRTCANCGLVKITRHEQDNTPRHWTEFRHGDKRVVMHGEPNKTPPCASYAPVLESSDA
jgi:hypothetical protein